MAILSRLLALAKDLVWSICDVFDIIMHDEPDIYRLNLSAVWQAENEASCRRPRRFVVCLFWRVKKKKVPVPLAQESPSCGGASCFYFLEVKDPEGAGSSSPYLNTVVFSPGKKIPLEPP